MKRFNAYIDGFNLYKGALEKRPSLKWLDLLKFSQNLRPHWNLADVYYFTAPIKKRYPGDMAPERQHSYLRVLEHQGVRVIRGKFRKDNKWLRVATSNRHYLTQPRLPAFLGATQCALNSMARKVYPDLIQVQIVDMEEKGSDVNLASYLLRDVYKKNIDAALVVTGDSDLTKPILFTRLEGVDVHVAVPNRNQSVTALREAATTLHQIRPSELELAQLPRTFLTPRGGNIVRPATWS